MDHANAKLASRLQRFVILLDDRVPKTCWREPEGEEQFVELSQRQDSSQPSAELHLDWQNPAQPEKPSKN
jgi:hypothetical protein